MFYGLHHPHSILSLVPQHKEVLNTLCTDHLDQCISYWGSLNLHKLHHRSPAGWDLIFWVSDLIRILLPDVLKWIKNRKKGSVTLTDGYITYLMTISLHGPHFKNQRWLWSAAYFHVLTCQMPFFEDRHTMASSELERANGWRHLIHLFLGCFIIRLGTKQNVG